MKPGYLVFDPAITSGVGQGTVSSGTPTLTSKVTTLDPYVAGLSYDIDKTGNLAGTLTVEFTNDPAEASWKTYTITIPAIAGGTDPQKFGLEIVNIQFHKMRLKLVVSAGTGAFSARINVTRRGS